MARIATTPKLSEVQKKILLAIIKCRDSGQHLVRRIRIVLLAADGQNNKQIAPQVELYVNTVSVDEKTGIQALEREAPDLPMIPGHCAKREYEYIRHGTLCLIAAFCVVSGKVFQWMNETRTEEDFAFFIWMLLATDPNANWIFVADNLNTHCSESLVRLVAELCGITDDLGEKGKSGVLKSVESRAVFLSDATHRIRFVYTPKHCSWFNQIEIWFGILCRWLLNRSSFSSLDEMRNRVLSFIDYFNETMVKPFRWTYTGTPLKQ